MTGSIKSSITLNIQQNQSDFELEDLKDSPIIFKEKLFSKVLYPSKSNPERLKNY